jgi:hypothetical protein
MELQYEQDYDEEDEPGVEELILLRKKELDRIEASFKNNTNEEDNENLRNLSKQAGKWKEKEEFSSFVSA